MSDNTAYQPIDVRGPDLEEAINEGLAQLGLARSEVIIEIVDEGRQGMLGLGAKEAVVRLTPLRAPREAARPETAAPPPAASPGASHDDDLEEDDDPDDQPIARQTVTPTDADDDARIGTETLQELLDLMTINGEVETYRAEDGDEGEEVPWVLNVKGEDLGILIGRRGETLNALQYLTRQIASRDLQRRANFVIDVQDYKQRREVTLKKLAKRMAEQARRIKRTVTLEPMPPNERRIIHMTLRSDRSVTTESVGVGDRRKVTIIPLKD